MKRIMPWVVMPLLASFPLVACDSDDGEKDTTSDTSDTSQPGDTTDTTQPGVSALTGVNTNVTVTTPTPNASCNAGAVDTGTHGAKYPWGGLTAGSSNFTCNKCPGGIDSLQGRWRAHGWQEDKITPDYEIGSQSNEGEILYIDGNTWYSHWVKPDGTEFEVRGWYMCSQQPEHPNEHLFWVSLEAVPSSALGNEVKSIYRSNVKLDAGINNMLFEWFNELTGSGLYQTGYCKIGTERGGVTCNNPFE